MKLDEAEIASIEIAPIEVELRAIQIRGENLLLQTAPGLSGGKAKRSSFFGRHLLFIVTVVLPLLCAGVYLFAVATSRFVSESTFIIRSTNGGGGELGGLASMVQTTGATRAVDETYAVNDYLVSRDVLDLLVANDNLLGVLSRPGADPINRFPTFWQPNTKEQLYQRFKSMVSATVDDGTGISTLAVDAFSPEDAKAILTALLGYAEAQVNKLNERAYHDALNAAGRFVDIAMGEMRQTEDDLNAYREKSGMVDPHVEADATLKTIQTLAVELARIRASISQQTTLAPSGPQMEALRGEAEAYETEIAKLKTEVAGTDSSFAAKMPKFEELALRREIAAKSLENSVGSLNKAREDIARQHLYVQIITKPNAPDVAKYPRKILDMAAILAIALMSFVVLRAFTDSAREHRA